MTAAASARLVRSSQVESRSPRAELLLPRVAYRRPASLLAPGLDAPAAASRRVAAFAFGSPDPLRRLLPPELQARWQAAARELRKANPP